MKQTVDVSIVCIVQTLYNEAVAVPFPQPIQDRRFAVCGWMMGLIEVTIRGKLLCKAGQMTTSDFEDFQED